MSPYTFEFEGDTVREWTLTDTGAESRLVTDYQPSLYVSGPDDALSDLRVRLESDPKLVATRYERLATDLHEAHAGDRSRVLRADLERVGEARTLAREIRGVYEREAYAPGTFRLFDVDLSPGFRYCLDRGIDPTPGRDLRTLSIELSEPALGDGDVSAVRVEGEPIGSAETDAVDVLRTLEDRLERDDPDILVVSHADLIPLLDERATERGLERFCLGRLPGDAAGWGEQLRELRARGPLGALSRSGSGDRRRVEQLPLAPVGAGRTRVHDREDGPPAGSGVGSIGTLLTSRQIRLARDREVLAPWNKWVPERFTDVRTLHAADRGGFTFAPEVGFHEDVHEIDFASLYPRIICEHNVSPETVDCGCRDESSVDTGEATDALGGDGRRVPELGYRICGDDGFLPDVLEPLLEDRARKRRLAADPSEEEPPACAASRARSSGCSSPVSATRVPKRHVRANRVPRSDQRLRP